MIRVALFAALTCTVSAAEDEVTEAPRHTYRIVQHYADNWDAVLHFRDPPRADVELARDPDRYPWPAIYHISSDDQWIFRDQKTGSGTGCGFLYRVEQSGRVWCMAQRLDDLAFAYLAAHEHVTRSDYYHVGLEFIAWDLPAQTLHFRVRGSAQEEGKSHLDRELSYHLASHEITQ